MNLFQNYSPLLDLHVGGRVIRTTVEHPFWVIGKGWTAAQQVVPGDLVLGADNEQTPVTLVDGPEEPAPVYNLEIEGYHTYLVGSTLWGFAAWAHNNELCAAGKVHLNSNEAVSEFGIYEIKVNGELAKIGKADLNRVTQSSGP